MELISVMPPDTLGQRVRAMGGFSQFAGELDQADRVANAFQSQTPTFPHLDVLVQIPVPSKWQDMNSHYHSANLVPVPQDEYPFKRRRLANVANLSWLKEVHSKIWNKKELEPDLFRKVEVTKMHYIELRNRLKVQHSDRDFSEYDGRKHTVRDVKLDVLRLVFPANSPLHPDNNEDRVDDDYPPEASDDDAPETSDDDAPEASDDDAPETSDDDAPEASDDDAPETSDDDGSEINTIFPSTLRFLDLSTLGLKECITHRLPLPLFIRQEYDHISTLIKNEPRNRYGSMIVSGQPGTGEVLVSLSHRI